MLLHLPLAMLRELKDMRVGRGKRWRRALHAGLGMEESLGRGRIIFKNLIHYARDAAHGNTQYLLN